MVIVKPTRVRNIVADQWNAYFGPFEICAFRTKDNFPARVSLEIGRDGISASFGRRWSLLIGRGEPRGSEPATAETFERVCDELGIEEDGEG